MACQSLDNDEILNVRWATEDPNPTSKVAEKRRLEEIGQKTIQEKMDPRIVDAMRAMRALEDGDVLGDEAGEEERDTKRRRLEDGDEGEDSDVDYEQEAALLQAEAEAQQQQQVSGLLSSDTLESLKYFAQIQKQNGVPRPVASKPSLASAPAGLGLADYASDDE